MRCRLRRRASLRRADCPPDICIVRQGIPSLCHFHTELSPSAPVAARSRPPRPLHSRRRSRPSSVYLAPVHNADGAASSLRPFHRAPAASPSLCLPRARTSSIVHQHLSEDTPCKKSSPLFPAVSVRATTPLLVRHRSRCGLRAATDLLFFGHCDHVVMISVAFLIALFSVQRYGTSKAGLIVGPALFIWFCSLGGIGIYNLLKYDTTVLRAFNPIHIYHFSTTILLRLGMH